MQDNASNRSLFYSALFSVLLHLLIILSFTTIFLLQPEHEEEKHPTYYTPAYTYTGAITPSFQQQKSENTPQPQHKQKLIPTAKTGIPVKSILALSREVLREDRMKAAISNLKNSEPVLLIGDLNTPADPLIRLLARSLSAHFKYPQFEGRLGAKGRVVVSLTLHPEGNISDIEIVRSSENQDFDAAALYAANTAPTVSGADMFISKPKFFVIGFIFY